MITGRIRSTVTPGPAVRFQCPRCGNAVTGSSRCRAEKYYALGLVPLFSKATTYVACGSCYADFLSKLNLDQLEQNKGEDISRYLSFTNSLVTTVLVVSAALLFWAPIVGLITAVLAVAFTSRRPGGWMKMVSRIALGLTILAHIGFVLLEIFVKKPAGI